MDSNRVRLSLVREATLGTTPTTPRMRTARMSGEGLSYAPQFIGSDEIRADRASADPSKINETNQGPINFTLSYPQSLSALSELLSTALMNPWVNTPEWDNDGTADSVITGIVASTGTITVIDQSGAGGFAGSAVKVGHLVRLSGFSTNNNIVKRVGSAGTATTIVLGASTLVDDAAPAAAARLKVVGFEGASADIRATATGLASTALDFTTLGLRVGQWLKVGGASTANQFATAACNDWVRITGITATALTCDNLPSGWAVDAGTGKTIRCFFGDVLANGQTLIGLSVERSFLSQASPTHILQKGMVGATMEMTFATEQAVKGVVTLQGLSGQQGTTANGGSYAPATAAGEMTSNISVGRIAEGGATVSSPNWVQSARINLNNNIRTVTAVGNVGAVAVSPGELQITGQLDTTFGSNALFAKLMAGTPSSVSLRTTKDGQAVIPQLPRIIFTGGSPNAQGKNQTVVLPLQFQASIDPLTGAQMLIDRLEYFEA